MKLPYAALLALTLSTPALAGPITVAGTSDPWLAGMVAGTVASTVDHAPAESPVLVADLALTAGQILMFSVTGGVMNHPGCPLVCDGPDGDWLVPHYAGSEHGMSSVIAPLNSLMGVFLGDASPHLAASPVDLDFRLEGIGMDFLTLAPALRQVFFIGDGRTSGSDIQLFIVPDGATRLYLGTMDGFEWLNNSGAFLVEIGTVSDEIVTPEPASLLLLGTGLLTLGRKYNRSKDNRSKDNRSKYDRSKGNRSI